MGLQMFQKQGREGSHQARVRWFGANFHKHKDLVSGVILQCGWDL